MLIFTYDFKVKLRYSKKKMNITSIISLLIILSVKPNTKTVICELSMKTYFRIEMEHHYGYCLQINPKFENKNKIF